MDYKKVIFNVTPNTADFRDLLAAKLGEIGFESFTENEEQLEGYIPENFYNEEYIGNINSDNFYQFTYKSELIPDQNWNEVWEKNYFEPLLIADKCLIRAPFHKDYPVADFEIVIEPKMAFGTGNHETTSLMIEHILELDLQNKNILDMGCGTGVLAMLSSMKGAGQVTAIDIDKWAFESTQENCQINSCNNVDVYMGNASLLGSKKFDIIFANIHKNILLEDLNKYHSVLNNEGILIMSGFYTHDLEDISNGAINLNLNQLKTKKKNNWLAVSFKKQN